MSSNPYSGSNHSMIFISCHEQVPRHMLMFFSYLRPDIEGLKSERSHSSDGDYTLYDLMIKTDESGGESWMTIVGEQFARFYLFWMSLRDVLLPPSSVRVCTNSLETVALLDTAFRCGITGPWM
jgi:hypothetical protein